MIPPPCLLGMECGFPLVITPDMTIHDVRNKVASRLRDKPEKWKIFRIDTINWSHRLMMKIWKEGE